MTPVTSQPLLLPDSTLSGGATAAPGRQQVHAWLREFEHARWTAQPRFDPADPASGADRRADAPSPPPASIPSALDHDAPPGDVGRQEPAFEPVQTVLAARAALGGLPFARMHRPMTAPMVVAGAASRPVIQALADASADRTERVDAMAHAAPETECPQRMVHVFVGDGSTSVWIRDARLKTQDAVRVLNELEIDAPAAGKHRQVIHLSLNGRPVKRSEP